MSIISSINQYKIQTNKEEIDIIKFNIYLILNYINSTQCSNSLNLTIINVHCKQLLDNIKISNSYITYCYLYSFLIFILIIF